MLHGVGGGGVHIVAGIGNSRPHIIGCYVTVNSRNINSLRQKVVVNRKACYSVHIYMLPCLSDKSELIKRVCFSSLYIRSDSFSSPKADMSYIICK